VERDTQADLPMKITEAYDAVVVGGGLTGYAAGILMARSGLRVAVVEGFPWEWWLRPEGEAAPGFRNYSGALLYGVPGYAPVNSLLMEIGIPLNNPTGEGSVSFQNLEPGFQVLQPGRWVNLFPGLGEIGKELERVFPGEGEKLDALYEEAARYRRKAENYWPGGAGARGREGGTSLSVFLDSWAQYWSIIFGGRVPTAARALSCLGTDTRLAGYAGLFFQGMARRRPGEAPVWELFQRLEMTSAPACIINETGQRGIFLCLRGIFQKVGGVIYRTAAAPRFDRHRDDYSIEVEGRRQLLGRTLILDGPEAGFDAAILDRWWPRRRKDAARPALHLTWSIPWESVPAGMGGHLIMDPEGVGAPLLLTLAPGEESRASLEILAAAAPHDPAAGTAQEEADILRRVRGLLRFLPESLPAPLARRGHFTSCYGSPGLLDRLRSPGPVLCSPSIHGQGHAFLTGRGEYLGSDLFGALADGQALAHRIIRKR
jgi:hypothetical protein